jgi:hypothetical protein
MRSYRSCHRPSLLRPGRATVKRLPQSQTWYVNILTYIAASALFDATSDGEDRCAVLQGKTVLVTGGGGGIGSAICRRFADEGARVVVADINAAAAGAVVEALAANGAEATATGRRPDRPRHATATAVAEVEADVRRHRHSGQQCRLGSVRPVPEEDAGVLGKADRHQPARGAEHHPSGACLDGGARRAGGRVVHRLGCRAWRLVRARRSMPPARPG